MELTIDKLVHKIQPISAGEVCPDRITPWLVVDSKKHEYLQPGYTVWMVEDPDGRNWLIDCNRRLHRLMDRDYQYIILKQKIN